MLESSRKKKEINTLQKCINLKKNELGSGSVKFDQ